MFWLSLQSKIEQGVLQVLNWVICECLPNQKSELVCVKAGCWNTDSPRPIVIVVTLVVGQLPKLILGQISIVIQYCVLRSCYCPNTYILCYEKKIKIAGYYFT